MLQMKKLQLSGIWSQINSEVVTRTEDGQSHRSANDYTMLNASNVTRVCFVLYRLLTIKAAQ